MKNPNNPKDKAVYCDLCCLQPDGRLVWPKHWTPGLATYDAPLRIGSWGYVCERHEREAYIKSGKRVNRM